MDIIDEDVHHGVFCPLFDIVALEQKSVCSEAQFGERIPEFMSLEANRFIEPQTCLKLLCWKERAKRANSRNEMSDGVHRYSLQSWLVHAELDTWSRPTRGHGLLSLPHRRQRAR